MDISQLEISIAPEKITDYLLNENHPDGHTKAAFFHAFDFDEKTLYDTLIEHLKTGMSRTKQTEFGLKYIVEGKATAPDGRKISLRSVWIKLKGKKVITFVTAYPL